MSTVFCDRVEFWPVESHPIYPHFYTYTNTLILSPSHPSPNTTQSDPTWSSSNREVKLLMSRRRKPVDSVHTHQTLLVLLCVLVWVCVCLSRCQFSPVILTQTTNRIVMLPDEVKNKQTACYLFYPVQLKASLMLKSCGHWSFTERKIPLEGNMAKTLDKI